MGYSVLKEYLKKKVKLDLNQFDSIIDLGELKKVKKNDVLLSPGDISYHSYFVTSGCLRSYVIDEKGKEHVLQFAPVNWWIGDLNSLYLKNEAMFFIDVIEDATVIKFDKNFFDYMDKNIIQNSNFERNLIISNLGAYQKRLIDSMSVTAEERYLKFTKTYPEIVLSVPQKMLASYLGITPESLSRIRKTLALNA